MKKTNETDYQLSLAIAKLLFSKGVITKKEFEKLDQLNRSSFLKK